MYKCYCCRCVFEECDTRNEEPCYVPSPFGSGYVQQGGGSYKCCPECGSEDYGYLEFDGINCPFCENEIDFSGIANEENFEYKCKKCKHEFEIKNGDILI